MAGRGKKITEVERDQIVALYASGLSMRKVAAVSGRSYGAVNAVLHREGSQVSARGGYRRCPE